MKTIYYIGNEYSRGITTGEIPVVKETEKMYYIDRAARKVALHCCEQFRKSEEGINWTTDKAKFKEVAQKYVDDKLYWAKKRLLVAQNELEKLKHDIIALGLEVKQ